MEIKTVIIDDEPLAVEVLLSYCLTMPYVKVLKTFTNPVEALGFIHKNAVDLIFLDIQMPQLTGLEFMGTLAYKPKVIFTTAYPQYAVEGFELEALDYLVKPISYKRFLKAVNKVNPVNPIHEIQHTNTESDTNSSPFPVYTEDSFIFLKVEFGSVKVFLHEILYVQGLKDYLKVYLLNGRQLLTLSSFKSFMDRLPKKQFFRIHNSYIVNLTLVDAVERNRVIVGNTRIPISDTYRKPFLDRLGV